MSGGIEVVEGEQFRSIVGRDFALVFARLGDRWTHSFEVTRTPGGPREVRAQSLEWDADRDDPIRVVSPVFQELQFQDGSDGLPRALLLGRSGRHHFSAMFAVARSGEGLALDIDVADRCREPSEFLASTYTVSLHSGELVGSDTSAIAWELGPNRLTFASRPGTLVGLAEAGRRSTRVQATAATGLLGPTKRWHYLWNLLEPLSYGRSVNRDA